MLVRGAQMKEKTMVFKTNGRGKENEANETDRRVVYSCAGAPAGQCGGSTLRAGGAAAVEIRGGGAVE